MDGCLVADPLSDREGFLVAGKRLSLVILSKRKHACVVQGFRSRCRGRGRARQCQDGGEALPRMRDLAQASPEDRESRSKPQCLFTSSILNHPIETALEARPLCLHALKPFLSLWPVGLGSGLLNRSEGGERLVAGRVSR